jgi:hypothetical protein
VRLGPFAAFDLLATALAAWLLCHLLELHRTWHLVAAFLGLWFLGAVAHLVFCVFDAGASG